MVKDRGSTAEAQAAHGNTHNKSMKPMATVSFFGPSNSIVQAPVVHGADRHTMTNITTSKELATRANAGNMQMNMTGSSKPAIHNTGMVFTYNTTLKAITSDQAQHTGNLNAVTKGVANANPAKVSMAKADMKMAAADAYSGAAVSDVLLTGRGTNAACNSIFLIRPSMKPATQMAHTSMATQTTTNA